MGPPTPLVPLPTDSDTRPARPVVATPEPSSSAPLLPLTELPELNTSAPLTPLTPAFVLRIVITPLVVAVPSPAAMLTAPPVCTVLRPADTCTEPPALLVDDQLSRHLFKHLECEDCLRAAAVCSQWRRQTAPLRREWKAELQEDQDTGMGLLKAVGETVILLTPPFHPH